MLSFHSSRRPNNPPAKNPRRPQPFRSPSPQHFPNWAYSSFALGVYCRRLSTAPRQHTPLLTVKFRLPFPESGASLAGLIRPFNCHSQSTFSRPRSTRSPLSGPPVRDRVRIYPSLLFVDLLYRSGTYSTVISVSTPEVSTRSQTRREPLPKVVNPDESVLTAAHPAFASLSATA